MKWSKPELVLLSGKAAIGTCSCEQGNDALTTLLCRLSWIDSPEKVVICDNGSAAVPACAEGGAFVIGG